MSNNRHDSSVSVESSLTVGVSSPNLAMVTPYSREWRRSTETVHGICTKSFPNTQLFKKRRPRHKPHIPGLFAESGTCLWSRRLHQFLNFQLPFFLGVEAIKFRFHEAHKLCLGNFPFFVLTHQGQKPLNVVLTQGDVVRHSWHCHFLSDDGQCDSHPHCERRDCHHGH